MQARADDDFGVKQLDLVYSVNGGPEKTVSIYGKGAKPLTEVSAGHTVYMEELGVKPGDFVSYYAKAHDTDTVKGRRSTSSDIYFIKIRPFSQNFREAQSQAGGGGGGGGGGRSAGRRRALRAAAPDHLGDVQRRARQGEEPGDKVKEDTVFVQLVAVEAARGSRRARRSRCGSARCGGGENLQKIAEVLPKAAAGDAGGRRPAQEIRRPRTRWRRSSGR